MTPRCILNQSLNKAIRDLKKHGLIDSPVFYVKSKKQNMARVVYRPFYDNSNDNREDVTVSIKQICENVDAKEVLTVANTYAHDAYDTAPPSEAIYVSLERRSKIYSVLQPYSVNGLGKIKIHKNRKWQTKDKTGHLGNFECLVQ